MSQPTLIIVVQHIYEAQPTSVQIYDVFKAQPT
eukprot:Gb_10297 [translate_table: standard]